VAEAARAAPPPPRPPRATDLLLDGLALRVAEGPAAGAPLLKRALSAFRSQELGGEEAIHGLWLAGRAAADMWEEETWDVLSARHVELARDAGALTGLPVTLSVRVAVHLFAGDLAAARSLVEEVRSVTEATGSHFPPYGALSLAAWRGREAEASALIEAGMSEVMARGEGPGLTAIHWANAVLYNGLGRYEDALAHAQQASAHPEELLWFHWGLPELIEAAVRTGDAERAADALQPLSRATRASSTDWGLGIHARSQALLSAGEAADALYREAIERLARTRIRVDLARAHLLYGEWLRREHRRIEARRQLRTAHELLMEMGIEAFAERAARELLATGETARTRTVETSDQLTPREEQIARLAGEGLSNHDIGTQLFISARTVEYHLTKIFAKLDIGSRRELRHILAGDADTSQPV
jgi:DNA-binding CsgD family transcriptional regulator